MKISLIALNDLKTLFIEWELDSKIICQPINRFDQPIDLLEKLADCYALAVVHLMHCRLPFYSCLT